MADDKLVDPVVEARRAAIVASLLEERRGYEVRGQDERVAEVDKALFKAGHREHKGKDREKETARSVPAVENRVVK